MVSAVTTLEMLARGVVARVEPDFGSSRGDNWRFQGSAPGGRHRRFPRRAAEGLTRWLRAGLGNYEVLCSSLLPPTHVQQVPRSSTDVQLTTVSGEYAQDDTRAEPSKHGKSYIIRPKHSKIFSFGPISAPQWGLATNGSFMDKYLFALTSVVCLACSSGSNSSENTASSSGAGNSGGTTSTAGTATVGGSGGAGGTVNFGGSGTGGATGPTSPSGTVALCEGDACPLGACVSLSSTPCSPIYTTPVGPNSTYCNPGETGSYCLQASGVLWAVVCNNGATTISRCDHVCGIPTAMGPANCHN